MRLMELVEAGAGRVRELRASPSGDLRRALDALSRGGVTVRLRPAAPGLANLTGRDLPFPDVVPIGADYREGGLAI